MPFKIGSKKFIHCRHAAPIAVFASKDDCKLSPFNLFVFTKSAIRVLLIPNSRDVAAQQSLGLIIQALLRKLRDPSIVALVRLFEISTHPGLVIIAGLRPWVLGLGADGDQRSEADTE